MWRSTSSIHPLISCFLNSIALYWSAQVVGSLGFGDINVNDNYDAIFSVCMIILCCLCKAVFHSRIIAVFIYYEHQSGDKSSRISLQRAILKQMGKADKGLINRVTQLEELQRTRLNLLDSERAFFPRSMYDEMLFQTYQSFLEQLGFINIFGDGELRFLASNFRIIALPRNELLIADNTVVRFLCRVEDK